MTFDARNKGIQRQQKWQGIFPHKPFLLKTDHIYQRHINNIFVLSILDTIILVFFLHIDQDTKFCIFRAFYKFCIKMC